MNMTTLRRAFSVMALFAVLAAHPAAAGPFDGWYDEDSAKSMQPTGQVFNQTLFTEYRKLSDARDSVFGGDGVDAELFNHKALLASTRTAVQEDAITDRNLSVDAQRMFMAARERLRNVFDKGGRELAPVETGVAQVSYDCWIEATERNGEKDAALCKKKFEDAIAAAEAKANYELGKVNIPAPPPPPAPPVVHSKPFQDYYRVGFVFDKTIIVPESESVLQQAIRDAQAHPDLKIAIRAHADRSGSDDYNLKLSRRRAEAVLSRLAAAGVDSNRLHIVQAVGERRPLIPTADGVKEAANRVVEIDLRFYNQ